MNISFRKIFWILAALIFSACVQGPWDYEPGDDEVYRGLYLSGYLVADRGISNLCVERTVPLVEANTQSFAFYDSATLKITASDGQEYPLTPKNWMPNCFDAPLTFIPQRAQSYRIDGRVVWDSAGTQVVTTFDATANVPTSFSVLDSARASSQILLTEVASMSADPMAYLTSLPPEVQTALMQKYGAQLMGKSEEQLNEWFVENGAQFQRDLDSLVVLYDKKVYYFEGDTVSYLSGALNTDVHSYDSEFSDDVGGVLLTHKLPDQAIVPATAFSTIFGEPSISSYYTSTQYRRLSILPKLQGQSDVQLLDSMPVSNAYFMGGKNTLYFYAVEDAYIQYNNTAVLEANNPKVERLYNVNGIRGFITGAILDSFVLEVRIPKGVTSYSNFQAKADFCTEVEGGRGDQFMGHWTESNTCYLFEPEYCRYVGWKDSLHMIQDSLTFKEPIGYNDCRVDAIYQGILNHNDEQYYIDSLGLTKASSIELDAAVNKYCLMGGWDNDRCATIRTNCRSDNPDICARRFWENCKITGWQNAGCDEAMVSYCKLSGEINTVLCREADKWCQDNPDEIVCQLEKVD